MWQQELVIVLRALIDDLFPPQLYEDADLQQIILVAAQLSSPEAKSFSQVYTIDVDQLQLTPDPTESPKDNAFITLVSLKAACILDMAEARKAGTQAYSFKEGTSAADLRGIADARLKFMKEGYCKQYSEALLEYLSTGQIVGAAITTPVRINGLTNASSYSYR